MHFSFATQHRLAALAAALALISLGCEGSGAHLAGPKGQDAFTRFVAIGTSLSAGMQSGGVVYSSQAEAWPSLLAHQAEADFAVPSFRAPGCTPPLISPLRLGRYLSGASAWAGEASCSGVFSGLLPPLNNVALPDATAWTALNLTPRTVAASPSKYGASDRQRYPLVLGTTQSQVTAMLMLGPSLVAVELGLEEILGAATSGLLTPATSYTQSTPFTYVPSALFAPVYTAIADSVKGSGARAVLISVPIVTGLASWRTGDDLWNGRADLALGGVVVAEDCRGSANLVFTPPLIPALVEKARAVLAPQPLSCADVKGAADFILTPGDVATLAQVVDQMNALIRQIADQNRWAFVDANTVFGSMAGARAPYSLSRQLGCALPYGRYLSLDGVRPNVAGHQLIANAAAEAINAKFGFAIPLVPVPAASLAELCP